MAQIILSLFIVFLIPSLAQSTEAKSNKAKEIIQKQKDQNKGFHDEVSSGEMTLISASGNQTIREFEYRILEETDKEGGKSLIKILKPADLSGTGLLSYSNKDKSNDQWIYLPALKKTKRIAGGSRSGNFIGSEFSYEDLSPGKIEDYTYNYLRKEPCKEHQCHVIEYTPQDQDSSYSKIINWIREDHLIIVKSEFYNKKNQLEKIGLSEDYKLYKDKYWRPTKLSMKNLINQKETIIKFSDRKIQSGLSTAQLSKRALSR